MMSQKKMRKRIVIPTRYRTDMNLANLLQRLHFKVILIAEISFQINNINSILMICNHSKKDKIIFIEK